MTDDSENNLIQKLQTPAAIVTYRAVVGFFTVATVALVGFIGHNIQEGITQLQASMVQVQVSVAHNSGRIDSQDTRLGRVELSIDEIEKENGSLDHRVTVIESRHR